MVCQQIEVECLYPVCDMTAATTAGSASLKERAQGRKGLGEVDLHHFDRGVIETMGGVVVDDNYIIPVTGVPNPPGYDGIPVTFVFPEDVYEKHVLPAIVVRRDDVADDPSRIHPAQQQYRIPAEGASLTTYTYPDPAETKVSGYDRYEQRGQPEPVDLIYTITVLARHRGPEANALFRHVRKTYRHYSHVRVKDSIGDVRVYDVFREAAAPVDAIANIAGRVIGFSVTLRVEAHLDDLDPTVHDTARAIPTLTTNVTN